MNVLFIGASSVGPRWIMSALKSRGHQTFGIFIGYEDIRIGEEAVPFFGPVRDDFLVKNGINIVGLTVDSLNVRNAVRISEFIKKKHPGMKIVWGGIKPTIEPEESFSNSAVDYACIGEGEWPMLELCEALSKPSSDGDLKIRNIWARKDGRIVRNELRDFMELDAFPFDWEGIIYNGVFTGRGCAGNCTFCSSPYIKRELGIRGKYLRKRKLESVLAEIDSMIRHNFRMYLHQVLSARSLREGAVQLYRLLRYINEPVRIKDDSFIIDKEWFFRFIDQFSKKHARRGFICSARVNEIDLKVVDALKKGNCRTIILGFESGDETYRNRILKKQISDEQIRHVGSLLKKAGIPILGQWMIGMPGETPVQALKSLKMSLEIGDIPQVHIATPFPKTEMCAYAAESGFLNSDFKNVSGIYENFTMVSEELIPVFRLLFNAFKIVNLKVNSGIGHTVFARFKSEVRGNTVGSILLDGLSEAVSKTDSPRMDPKDAAES